MGGSQIGSSTLIRFYAWHLFGLTLVLITIGVWHIFQVRRDGGIAVPPPDTAIRPKPDHTQGARPPGRIGNAVGCDRVDRPVRPGAGTPGSGHPEWGQLPASESLAPWFFLWVQQLLRLGDPFIYGVLIPLGALLILALVPYITPLRLITRRARQMVPAWWAKRTNSGRHPGRHDPPAQPARLRSLICTDTSSWLHSYYWSLPA